jgi:hypothetical protein
MASINYAPLVEHYRADPETATHELKSAIRDKKIKTSEWKDLGNLFEACFGFDEYRQCRNDRGRLVTKQVFEAHGAVSTHAFQAISGQIVYSAIMEAYDAAAFVFRNLIPEVRTTLLNGERIAGITGLGEISTPVPEGEAFPLFGVSADWIQTPPLVKRGGIVPVTREAVFSDRTGVLLDRCSKVGDALALGDEFRAIDAVIDENATAKSATAGGHRYHRKDVSIATFGDVSGAHDFDNLEASNALIDWTDVEKAELLFDAMTDPGTGVPTGAFRAASNQIIVPSGLLHTAKHVLQATEVRLHSGGYATSGNPSERAGPNTLQGYSIISSPLLAYRMAVDTNWFVGNVGKALRKMVAWPLETTQAPSNSHDEFTRDIVVQYKAEQCDAYVVVEPRFLVKNTA